MNISLLFKQFLSGGPVSFNVFMVSLVIQRNVYRVICYQINQFICGPSANLLFMAFRIGALPNSRFKKLFLYLSLIDL